MQKRDFTDQLRRNIAINFPPKRIISLVPSQTELLFDLGLDEEIVGITKFCIHPKDKFKSSTKIGGTKKLDLKRILALQPDLIIGNKEENQKEDIAFLMQYFPVWMSDIYNLDDALEMIEAVGDLVDRKEKANEFVINIRSGFNQLKMDVQSNRPEKILYFIWKNPFMLAGKNTYIDEMLSCCGFENLMKGDRYPSLNESEMKSMSPDLVFLSSEPYPFQEKHMQELKEIWPKANVKLVDGEMFSWYGTRLLKSSDYFKSLI
jgi:ABC-type Fe3+-hydroxamate transport system substrate-binding protein